MADSGTYDQATLIRRAKIAEAMLGDPSRPVKHWAEGLNDLAKGGVGGYQLNQLDAQAKQQKDKESADLYATLGLPAPAATPAPQSGMDKIASILGFGGGSSPAAPSAPTNIVPPAAAAPEMPTAPPPTGAPMGGNAAGAISAAPDANLPRGYRNMNPGNIEDGPFSRSQPGYAGSDGRFAKFASMDAGTGAMGKLLDSYGNRGLTTVNGIINRWAPSSDGNNVSAYAANVSKQLGIGPDDPIPPEKRQQLIAAIAQHENGAALPNAAPANPQAPTAPPAQGAPNPVAAALANPAAPQTMPGGLLAGVPEGQKAAIAKLLTSSNPTMKALGTQMVAQGMKPNEYGFQTQPDGTILRTNPRTGTVEPVYQGATKPTFGVIGEEDGKKTYGFIDPAKGKVTPLEPAKPGDERPTVTGPDGKEIVIPKGVDVPTFKKEISKINADAAGGKMTEVQAKATSFANRMESAEANLAKGSLEKEAGGVSGSAQQVAGGLPVVGSALQSSNYQKFAQAKSQFITAMLRQESGAAINKEEFNRYDKEFFPQPGDKPEVIAQKAEQRKIAIEAMKKGAGPSYKSPAVEAKPRVTKSLGGKNYYQENGQWFEE